MASFGAYNEDEVEIKDGFDPLPDGSYSVTIVDSEEKTSKAGNAYISLDMVVSGGEMDGRHIFENLNIGHDRSDVVDMAYATIKKISIAIGKSGVKDSSDLHGVPFICTITNKNNKKGEMTEYRKWSSASSAPVEKPKADASGDKAPWE